MCVCVRQGIIPIVLKLQHSTFLSFLHNLQTICSCPSLAGGPPIGYALLHMKIVLQTHHGSCPGNPPHSSWTHIAEACALALPTLHAHASLCKGAGGLKWSVSMSALGFGPTAGIAFYPSCPSANVWCIHSAIVDPRFSPRACACLLYWRCRLYWVMRASRSRVTPSLCCFCSWPHLVAHTTFRTHSRTPWCPPGIHQGGGGVLKYWIPCGGLGPPPFFPTAGGLRWFLGACVVCVCVCCAYKSAEPLGSFCSYVAHNRNP